MINIFLEKLYIKCIREARPRLKIEQISDHFVFIVGQTLGLPKGIKNKVLTT